MVEKCLPCYSRHLFAVPISGQWLDYFDDQQKFVNKLPLEIRKQVCLGFINMIMWDQRDRWKDKIPDAHIDSGNQTILELIKKCRLCISTYNATSYLDHLAGTFQQ